MSSLATESYVENTLLNVVMKITSKNGEPGWVPSNLNEGHLDRFFFPSATLGALNFLLYVFLRQALQVHIVAEERRVNGG